MRQIKIFSCGTRELGQKGALWSNIAPLLWLYAVRKGWSKDCFKPPLSNVVPAMFADQVGYVLSAITVRHLLGSTSPHEKYEFEMEEYWFTTLPPPPELL